MTDETIDEPRPPRRPGPPELTGWDRLDLRDAAAAPYLGAILYPRKALRAFGEGPQTWCMEVIRPESFDLEGAPGVLDLGILARQLGEPMAVGWLKLTPEGARWLAARLLEWADAPSRPEPPAASPADET